MNKLLQKTMGKWKVWSVIAAAIIVVGLLVSAIFGFNLAATADDSLTVTVRLDSYASNAVVEKVESICDTEFKKLSLSYEYEVKANVSNGAVREYVYSFRKGTNEQTLESAKNSINAAFETEKQTEGSPLYNGFVNASCHRNDTLKFLAKGFVWRAVLAGAIALALVFVYCVFRLKRHLALTVTGATLVGGAMTLALVALLRIPVTSSIVYAAAFASLFTAAFSVLFAGNAKAAFGKEKNEELSTEETIASATPVKEIVSVAAVLLAGLVLIGAIGVTSVSWFAIAAVIGLLCGTFTVLVLLPAVYLPVRKAVDAYEAERARYDYKKGANKKTESENEAE